MLDFGFSEILLTSAIALVVLGPERLPKVARQVGNWMGRARAMARQLSEQLEREVSADELLKLQTKKLEARSTQRIAPPQGTQLQPEPAPEQLPTPPNGHAEYNPPVAVTATHVPYVGAPAAPPSGAYHAAGTDDSQDSTIATLTVPQQVPSPPFAHADHATTAGQAQQVAAANDLHTPPAKSASMTPADLRNAPNE